VSDRRFFDEFAPAFDLLELLYASLLHFAIFDFLLLILIDLVLPGHSFLFLLFLLAFLNR
jgi:hypothetical protein